MPFTQNTFATGEVADASKVNANFSEIYTELASFPSTNGAIASGAIGSTQLATDAVTASKIASGVITVAKIADAALVKDAGSILSTDNDTTLATTAAIVNHGNTVKGQISDGTTGLLGAYAFISNVLDGSTSGAAWTIYQAGSDTWVSVYAHGASSGDAQDSTDTGGHGIDDAYYISVSSDAVTWYQVDNSWYGQGSCCIAVPKDSYIKVNRTGGDDKYSFTYTSIGAVAMTEDSNSWT